MTEEKAIELAKLELHKIGEKYPVKNISAKHVDSNMYKGKKYSGWQVYITFDIKMDPNDMIIEIYDGTGEVVKVPMI